MGEAEAASEETKTQEYVQTEMETEINSETITEEGRRDRELDNAVAAKILETLPMPVRNKMKQHQSNQETDQDSSSGQEGVSVVEDCNRMCLLLPLYNLALVEHGKTN